MLEKKISMKVGDLVKHKRFGTCYIVSKVDDTAMIGVLYDSEIRYLHRNWIEVISESR